MIKRILGLILSLVMCFVFIAGCGADNKSVTPTPSSSGSKVDTTVKTKFGLAPFKEKQTIDLGFFSGAYYSYPFLIADKEGFFDELNIEIVYHSFTNGPGMMEANADWDIATAGLGGIVNGMIGHGLHVIDITDYEENNAAFVRKDSPIAKDPKNPEAWKGTTWIYPVGTTAQAILVAALKQLGLSLNDITSINMDVANAFSAFEAGEGDGMVVWDAIAFNAEDSGYVRVADGKTTGFRLASGSVASEKILSEKKDLVATAIALYHYTIGWIYENDQNYEKAWRYYLEDCKNEGIYCDEAIAQRVLEWYRGPKMDEFLRVFTETSPDDTGLYTSRELLQAEKDVLIGLDFFISQGNYTEDDRNHILNKKLINPAIAQAVKSLIE